MKVYRINGLKIYDRAHNKNKFIDHLFMTCSTLALVSTVRNFSSKRLRIAFSMVKTRMTNPSHPYQNPLYSEIPADMSRTKDMAMPAAKHVHGKRERTLRDEMARRKAAFQQNVYVRDSASIPANNLLMA